MILGEDFIYICGATLCASFNSWDFLVNFRPIGWGLVQNCISLSSSPRVLALHHCSTTKS